jgi:RNA polymerase sigma factor (sigma-70 family)
MSSFNSPSRTSWRRNDRRKTGKFATIQPVLNPNRELPQEQLFREQQATIRKAAAYFCRRYGFSREEIEDFTQHVLLKIWADDCAVLRKYQGRSSLPTYLATVVHKALLDYVNHRWGKWRTSTEAQRLGQLAMDLETLLVRDRMGFDEACQTLRSRGATASDAELRQLADKLPPRSPRRLDASYESEGGGPRTAGGAHRLSTASGQRAEPAAAESADELLWSRERIRKKQAALQALKVALAALPAEDCVIARTISEVSLAEVARIWKLDQKALYRRRKKILRGLREALERAGISAEDIGEILGDADI